MGKALCFDWWQVASMAVWRGKFWSLGNGAKLPGMRRSRSSARGFTLTELMVVVVLVGVLAAIAIPVLRGRLESARGSAGLGAVRAIAAAQERFRSEHLVYLDVSSSMTDYFPRKVPGQFAAHFRSSDDADATTYAAWEVLAPDIREKTQHVFATKAGLAGTTEFPLTTIPVPFWPAQAQGPWYVIQAAADLDGDGVQQILVLTSVEPTILMQNEGE